jgi:hypothetical protein
VAQTILIAIASGFAAALLFLAPASGTALAFPLFILTGLPLAIATLGWGAVAGVIAAAAGAVVAYAIYPGSIVSPAMFLSLYGIPVVWLAHRAASRPSTPAANHSAAPAPMGGKVQPVEWAPWSHLLLQLVATASIAVIAAGIFAGYDPETLVTEASSALADVLATMQTAAPSKAADLEPAVRLYVSAMPFIVGAVVTAILTFDLWIGALVARGSGRVARWPDALYTAELPRPLLPAFFVATAIAFIPGVPGEIGKVVSGAIFTSFVLIGLAVLHARSRGNSSRVPVLVLVYILLIFSGFLAVLFAIVGAVENFARLRARRPPDKSTPR